MKKLIVVAAMLLAGFMLGWLTGGVAHASDGDNIVWGT